MSTTSPPDALPPPPPMTVRTRLAYWRYLALWETAARLPERVARGLPERVGRAWHRFGPAGQRRQVRANLRRVVGDVSRGSLDALVGDAYVSYARYWLDSFRLHRMDPAHVVASVIEDGVVHGDAIRDAGAGGIFVTAHLGSWDIGALYTAQRRWGMVVVAEVVEPRALYDRFVRLRARAGVQVEPLLRGGATMRQLEERIRSGALATLLADRDLTRRGPIVSFFGEPCRLPAGPAVLAHRTGAPVVAGAFVDDGPRYHAIVRPPIPAGAHTIYDATQLVAHELERLIARFPAQWHVFVPNWLADREPRHPVVDAWRCGEDWRALARAERRAYTRQDSAR